MQAHRRAIGLRCVPQDMQQRSQPARRVDQHNGMPVKLQIDLSKKWKKYEREQVRNQDSRCWGAAHSSASLPQRRPSPPAALVMCRGAAPTPCPATVAERRLPQAAGAAGLP